MSKLQERNAHIYELRREGKTLQVVADMYGLSKERIRCIYDETQRKLENPPIFSVRAFNMTKSLLECDCTNQRAHLEELKRERDAGNLTFESGCLLYKTRTIHKIGRVTSAEIWALVSKPAPAGQTEAE
jgi:sigma-70-like protein